MVPYGKQFVTFNSVTTEEGFRRWRLALLSATRRSLSSHQVSFSLERSRHPFAISFLLHCIRGSFLEMVLPRSLTRRNFNTPADLECRRVTRGMPWPGSFGEREPIQPSPALAFAPFTTLFGFQVDQHLHRLVPVCHRAYEV